MDFEKLYIEYFHTVYGYLLSMSHDPHISEELTQEAFLKALKKISMFQSGTNAKAWLCQIAKNLFYDYIRRNKLVVKPCDSTIDQFVQELYPDVEESLIEKELSIRIHKILHTLAEPYREVFSLRVFGELSFTDIGAIFDKSDGWARTTYFRAKSKIREELKNENGL